jgi:hypothetical protein
MSLHHVGKHPCTLSPERLYRAPVDIDRRRVLDQLYLDRPMLDSRVVDVRTVHTLHAWGYDHKSVNDGQGEYARDTDGDGFCEVYVNTMNITLS